MGDVKLFLLRIFLIMVPFLLKEIVMSFCELKDCNVRFNVVPSRSRNRHRIRQWDSWKFREYPTVGSDGNFDYWIFIQCRSDPINFR